MATCKPGAMQYLLLFAIVFGVNLLPAFGPPTWTLLVFARLTWHLEPVAIVLVGAVAAMSGRYVLAVGTRHFRGRLGDKRQANLEAANDLLFAKKGRAWAIVAVFVVSPLPSAQLFVAAGLLDVALVPLTLAFFVGRLVSYSFYVAAATLAERQLGGVLRGPALRQLDPDPRPTADARDTRPGGVTGRTGTGPRGAAGPVSAGPGAQPRATMGLLSGLPPMEPRKVASPKAKMPPSEATSQ
jgi:membrane protein YqaA with SNARE-associated domain